MTAVVAAGLSDAEVAQRVAEGKTNDVPTRAARSVSEIVRANVFTRINAILGVLLVIVLSTGSVINGVFGLLMITLLVTAVWVLAVVARPYEWWRVALVAVSGLAYVVIFSIPLAQKMFMLDPSNVGLTSMALAIGVVGAAIIEVLWWVQGAFLGERRPLWK